MSEVMERVLEIGEVYKDKKVLQVYGEEHLVVECIYCKRQRVVNEEGIDEVSNCICIQAAELEGTMFGKLRVIKARLEKGDSLTCECECTYCGKVIKLPMSQLKNARSCGCMGRNAKDKMLGKQYGRLIARERAIAKDPKGNVQYICECTCDARSIVLKPAYYLRSGKYPNCGCLKRGEVPSE